MVEEMIVLRQGINGSSTYSLYMKTNFKPIFTNKSLKTLAEEIVRVYLKVSEKVSDYYERDFSSEFPPELDLSKFNPSERSELIKLVHLEFKRKNSLVIT